MNFLIVLVFVGLAAADVSHLTSNYLPPRLSTTVGNYNQGSDAVISRPLVSTYAARPEIAYSRQVNVVPSVQVIGGGYDSGLIGNDLISNGGLVGSGLIGNGLIGNGLYSNGLVSNGLIGNGLIGAYDSGLVGGNLIQGGLIGSGYGSGHLINGGLVGSGLRGLNGLHGGSNIIRTVSAPSVIASASAPSVISTAPVVSGAYESAIDTQYGSNGGYVYDKKH